MSSSNQESLQHKMEQHTISYIQLVYITAFTFLISNVLFLVSDVTALSGVNLALILIGSYLTILIARQILMGNYIPVQIIPILLGSSIALGLSALLLPSRSFAITSIITHFWFIAVILAAIRDLPSVARTSVFTILSGLKQNKPPSDTYVDLYDETTQLIRTPMYKSLFFEYTPRRLSKYASTNHKYTLVVLHTQDSADDINNFIFNFDSRSDLLETLTQSEHTVEAKCDDCQKESLCNLYQAEIPNEDANISSDSPVCLCSDAPVINLCKDCRESYIEQAIEKGITTESEMLVHSI